MSEIKKTPSTANGNWYQKLRLSDKSKLNIAIGMALISLGVILLCTATIFYVKGNVWLLYLAAGLATFNTGLWLFGRGLGYQGQLDAIRIAKRNNGGNNRNFKNRKPKPE